MSKFANEIYDLFDGKLPAFRGLNKGWKYEPVNETHGLSPTLICILKAFSHDMCQI